MTRALFLGLAVLVAGCRLEPTDPASAPPAAAPPAAAPPAAAPPAQTADVPVLPAQPRALEPALAPPADTVSVPGLPGASASPWTVPVVGVDPDDLADTFTDARSEGRTHNAIDIMAPRGTPVVAASPGTVQRLFTSDKGGITVYLLGDDKRTVQYYAHLDAYAAGLAEGQRIARGGAIGTVGDSGNAAPGNTHLHFAVWTIEPGESFWDGEPVNPYGLLAGGD